ncbi:hypothetical protein H072_2867 [Dactylellina haptotyla CBS 200.50]|uniref:Mannosyltransferase n=1 Tax=Dactylellina haptotyla (strain CBS 200.50) TaxID=1284197 RepID=S8BUD8_DACHA|nr:hypothetical protein H072_2867 [Dactylellina haptotyla CBS 200.50]
MANLQVHLEEEHPQIDTSSMCSGLMSSFATNSTFLIFLLVLGIRLLNALTVATFFQPDEYFQSLELAADWRRSLGYVTWEWKHGLRSTLYPRIFHFVYYIVDSASEKLNLSPATNAELLVVGPKVIGAITAAVGDVYTGLLAKKIWGEQAGRYALLFSVCSAWNWYCSTRTFSNCLETTLTIVGMTYWPWKHYSSSDLFLASIFAAVSFTVRPTNGLISWAIGPLLLQRLPAFTQRVSAVLQISIARYFDPNFLPISHVSNSAVSTSGLILLLNALLDSYFYRRITFPFIEFYRLNVTQSISEFYGVSPWHYYYSQGLPLLLTGYLPLALFSLYRGFFSSSLAEKHLALIANVVPLAFMITKHKEVRFIYPLLPILHVLMAVVGLPSLPPKWKKSLVIAAMVGLNIPIAYYTTYVHQRGVVDAVNWLRIEHYNSTSLLDKIETGKFKSGEKTAARVGFLMPCHSTPFISYMWEAGARNRSWVAAQPLSAWFLTCEPPIDIRVEDRGAYLDEADQFYANTTSFLMKKFVSPPILTPGEWEVVRGTGATGRELWPDKLVTFGATAALVEDYLRIGKPEAGYKECQRFFNSHWHDDDRRKGDVIVWCLK